MKTLVFGAGGQVARALMSAAPSAADIVGLTHDQCDIADRAQIDRAIAAAQPDLVFNAAAYTAVDAAETDAERAFAINGSAVGWMAQAAGEIGAKFVHISTDFVFDGRASIPYRVTDQPNPLSVYGRSKLAGEQASLRMPSTLVVRTAWVYATRGRNFVHTMLRLMATGREVRVVSDQVGAPTFAGSLAESLWRLAQADAKGILHVTDNGVASWYDFAVAIAEEAVALGLLPTLPMVSPIFTEDYPTAAVRPSYSVLDTRGAGAPVVHWRVNLRRMLQEVQAFG